jgi:hypothetical protein
MTIFDYETLTKLGARLFDHADSITSQLMKWRSIADQQLALSRTWRRCDSG